MSTDAKPFQVLALDGGGYRGLFVAEVLAKWEQQLGKPIASCFDLIVGTSTGGIIALGLAAGMSAAELVDFYVEDGKKIFPRRHSLWRYGSGAWHWFVRRYGAKALEDALRHRLPAIKLGELKKPVVIPAYNLQAGRHWLFKTPHFENNLLDRHRPLWEVARATSAAPTYFSAFRTGRTGELFVDGGLVANNPSWIGYVEVALKFRAHRDKIKILNIGTEGGECALPRWRLQWGGLLFWAKAAPSTIMQAQAVGTESMMRELVGPDNWLRVKPEHGRDFAPLDVYEPDCYRGLAANHAARYYDEAHAKFFSHQARTDLVLPL